MSLGLVSHHCGMDGHSCPPACVALELKVYPNPPSQPLSAMWYPAMSAAYNNTGTNLLVYKITNALTIFKNFIKTYQLQRLCSM
jgi:hypothetical protein